MLAQIASSNAYLFKPGDTLAIRAGGQNGTPLPHEEPQLANPPAGVVAYYWLKNGATRPLKIELMDGNAVRACAASDTPVHPPDTETLNVVADWQVPAQPPSAAAGMHRFALGAPAGRGGGGGGGGRGAAAPPAPDACTAAGVTPDTSANPDAGGRGGRGRGGRGGGGGRGGAGGLQPGQYTVRLTVDGQTYTQPVTIKPDPRGAQ